MKIETKMTHHVDYHDLDKAINEFLKKKGCKETFEFVEAHEMSNDTSKSFAIGLYKRIKINSYDKQNILNGDLRYSGFDILEWMYEEGVIPRGDYVVNVSW